jgi:hypothetical protein
VSTPNLQPEEDYTFDIAHSAPSAHKSFHGFLRDTSGL